MSIQKIKTFTNIGLIGQEIIIEADMNSSLPTIEIIGLPDAAIKESRERIRGTFRNLGIPLPDKKIILNLAPSATKKVWTRFDVPMAVAILQLIYPDVLHCKGFFERALFFGELGLDGKVKPVLWLLPSVVSALKAGYKEFFVPADNVYELEYIPDIEIYPIHKFGDIVQFFLWEEKLHKICNEKTVEDLMNQQREFEVDFAHIKGHSFAKRACMIAAAGQHNLLFVGAPWSGKTFLSRALQSILPPLHFAEILQVSQIYSVVGKLSKDQPLIIKRPFRQVHHTASGISIVWWWRNLRPGEISLAHNGILFLDEVTEFPREVLEVLRQPLEDKSITISRSVGSVRYPANVMFVGAMNPCKCGFYKDLEKDCICSQNDIRRYQSKLSGPLLDRIDMILEIPREKIDKLLDTKNSEGSQEIREKVWKAWQIQQKRYQGFGFFSNWALQARYIQKFIPLTKETKEFLTNATQRLELSGRVVHRLMKVARTIADLEWADDVEVSHLAEALQYKNKSMIIGA